MNETLRKTWSVLEILKVTEAAFTEKGITNPRLNAELLLSDVTGHSRFDLYLNFEKPLTENEVSEYRNLVKRRLKFEPLQYILGKTEFYSLNFKVTPDVLIPRQETEILVEIVLKYIKEVSKPRILEIGTGSGCIAVAIAANTDCMIDAIDISSGAIDIAIENSSINNTAGKINFKQTDFLNTDISFNDYDIIISNPPYIAARDIAGLNEEVNQYEPYIALTDDKEGMTFYENIFSRIANAGESPAVFLEIGDGKKDAIEKLLMGHGITNYKIYNDLIGLPRVLEIERKKRI